MGRHMSMNRRGFVAGLGALFVAAPAIVRVSSLMAMPRSPAILTPAGWVTAEDIKRVILEEYRRLEKVGLVENSDFFARSILVEQNPFDPNRVDVLIKPVAIRHFRNTLHAFENAVGRRMGMDGSCHVST
jgi:hypothetical protein